MAYTNYTSGVPTGAQGDPQSTYNLLISGGTDYPHQSGLLLRDDITVVDGKSHTGARLFQDDQNNAYFDFRTIAGGQKNMAFRLQDDSNPTASPTNMLLLTDDNKTSVSTYGAILQGRMKASQYYVGQADTRAPMSTGMYMGFDNNTKGYFNVNKGSGTGGFQFQTFNSNGQLDKINLNLDSTGLVQAPYYSASGNTLDSETVAIAGFDASGNLVRNFQQNTRFRSLEQRMAVLELETVQGLPQKLNEVIDRFNNLHFYSNNIQDLVFPNPPSPYIVKSPQHTSE